MASREFRVFALRMDTELKQEVLKSSEFMAKINLKAGNNKDAEKYRKISEQAMEGIRCNCKEIGELAMQSSVEIVRAYKVGAIGMTIVGIIVIVVVLLYRF